MPDITVRVRGGKRALRTLRRLRKKSVPFGIKNASDNAGKLLVKGFDQEWKRAFQVKRRTFPRQVLSVRRARVSGGRVSQNTRVVSRRKHDIFDKQLIAGTRRPPGGNKAFLIPVGPKRRRRRREVVKTYKAGKYIFESKPGQKDLLLAHFADTIRIPRRFSERRVFERINRIMPRLLRQAVRKEIRAVLARRG